MRPPGGSGVSRPDPGDVQRQAVRPGGVAVNVGEGDRVFRGSGIEDFAGGEAAVGREGVIPAATDDPGAGPEFRRPRRDPAGPFAAVGDPGEVHPANEREAGLQVDMAVHQPRQHRAPVELDDFGFGADPAFRLPVVPHEKEQAAADGQRLRQGRLRFAGVDDAAAEHQVGGRSRRGAARAAGEEEGEGEEPREGSGDLRGQGAVRGGAQTGPGTASERRSSGEFTISSPSSVMAFSTAASTASPIASAPPAQVFPLATWTELP